VFVKHLILVIYTHMTPTLTNWLQSLSLNLSLILATAPFVPDTNRRSPSVPGTNQHR